MSDDNTNQMGLNSNPQFPASGSFEGVLPPPVLPTNTNPSFNNISNTSNTPPSDPGFGSKKIPRKLLIFGGLFALGLLLFLIISFVIPRLSGSKEIALTWWGLWEDENIIAPIIAEYETSHPNVKIDYVKQSQTDYRERLMNALTQGSGPDIFRFHNTWVPMFTGELDTIPGTVYTPSEFDQTFYSTITSDLTSGTGIVGIPLDYDALTLFINTDIFTAAGKEAPRTWDDVRTLARELTVKDERGIITQAGIALGRTENVDHWPEILGLMMFQNRANLARPTGELAEKALEFYTLFSKVDKVWDETLPFSTSAFAGGKLAMYFAPSWRVFEIRQTNPSLKFTSVALPQIPKDNPAEPNVSYATYWVEGVSSKSANKLAAWEFLKYMSQKETLEKFFTGASAVRGFGEAYPRVDMADLLLTHPILGSIISLAPESKTWYLASKTNDGPTGINSQLEQYFKDAINAVNEGATAKSALETAAAGVSQVLSQYSKR